MNRQTLISVIVGIAVLIPMFIYTKHETNQKLEEAKASRARDVLWAENDPEASTWAAQHPDLFAAWIKKHPWAEEAALRRGLGAGTAPVDTAAVTTATTPTPVPVPGNATAATDSSTPIAGPLPQSRIDFDTKVRAQKEASFELHAPTFVATLDATGGALDTLTFSDIKEGSFKPLTNEDKKTLDDYTPLHVYGDPQDKKIRSFSIDSPSEKGMDQLPWLHSELPNGGHRFERVLPDGDLVVTKDFTPGENKDDYHFNLKITVENKGTVDRRFGYKLTGPAGLVEPTSSRPWGDEAVMATRDRVGNIDQQQDKTVTIVDKKKPLHIQGRPTEGMTVAYFGLSTKYFAAVVMPQESTHPLDSVGTESLVEYSHHTLTSADEKAVTAREDSISKQVVPVGVLAEFMVPPGQSASQEYVVFVGPRWAALLEDHPVYAKAGLAKLVDYSSWIPGASYLARVLTWILHKFQWVTGSWAIAILLLTLLVRGALHPVMLKQLRSSTKMQSLSPEMAKLKAKYEGKDGKMSPEGQKHFQTEQWALYKKHGVNPLGCAGPMFLQFPIFIGLYNALSEAYELRQAHFLWVRDLSEPDVVARLPFTLPMHGMNALCILPILMLLVYVGQNRSMPKPVDPQAAEQQKIMSWMMPFMGYMFYTMPSGLLLYYITSSTIGLFESRWIKRQIAAEQAQALGVPAPART